MPPKTASRLAIFNHKGGVGKTTLTVNLAAALAELGNRVLLVDSDPQCNITSYLLEDTVLDDLLDNSDEPTGETLWSALKPVAEAAGKARYVGYYETGVANLFLLPGDIRLSDFEVELATFWADCFQRKAKGFNGTTALSSLITTYVDKLDLDYVFYDTGPNIGPLNRVILLDCDYFIVPGACDLFSVRALKTLSHSLISWIRDWRTIANIAEPQFPRLSGAPKFLGYIPQGFRVYGHGMARWPSKYHARFNKELGARLMRPLKRLDADLLACTPAGARLGEVKDFAHLVQKSQEQRVPMWEVQGGPQYQTEQAREAFFGIATNILQRTQER